MNPKAAVPQSEPIPSCLLHCPCEVFRPLVLAFVSLAWILSKCPEHWLYATVLPVHKPGKPFELVTSYRPISILPFWYKILDRLLYQRLWPHIKQRTIPWQHGGVVGTDIAFALFHELVYLRKKEVLPDDVQFLFLDGQAAYCRPPKLCVLDALLQIPELGVMDIRLVGELLSGLKSRACILGEFTRSWPNETGLPQGGTLSVALFVLLTDAFYQMLIDKKLGLVLPQLRVPCPVLGYVDDLVLCLRNGDQKAGLQLAHAWSDRIRMKLNVGDDKSALLAPWVPGHEGGEQLCIDGTHVPIVQQYRYLGGLVSFDASVLPALRDVQKRVLEKTAALARWAQAQALPLPLLAKLWVIIVENAVLWLLAALPLQTHHLFACDKIQRKAGRILLGYHARSPIPPVLLELTWAPWSTLVPCRRVALLWRVLTSQHSLLRHLVPVAAGIPGSWSNLAAIDAQLVSGRASLDVPDGHDALLRRHVKEQCELARNNLLLLASSNGLLLHYPEPLPGCSWTLGEFNTPLSRLSARGKASVIFRRLFAGGQGLRGGDRLRCLQPTLGNCCLFCLKHRKRNSETLHHFLLDCPLPSDALSAVRADVESCMDNSSRLAALPIARLRRVQDALLRAWELRKAWLRQEGVLKASNTLRFAKALW